jgi:hypothetical protein
MVLTIIMAFVLVAACMLLLGIGWLITGKTKIERGACGRNPHKKNNDKINCGPDLTCSLCENEKRSKKP